MKIFSCCSYKQPESVVVPILKKNKVLPAIVEKSISKKPITIHDMPVRTIRIVSQVDRFKKEQIYEKRLIEKGYLD